MQDNNVGEFCIKVKRLFFVFADKHGHTWLEHIDQAAIDLGPGPRAVVKGASCTPLNRFTFRRTWSRRRRTVTELIRNLYAEQVRLLVQSLPTFARELAFALKGGTAINLFYRNTARLSVDIDLTYLPVEDEFGFAEMQVVSFEDLFGGKLHAALDRTHPRDLYDVKLLYDHEGLTDDLFRVFLVYVACSGRPMHELLGTDRQAQADLYSQEFVDMTRDPASLGELEAARECLVGDVATFHAQPDFDLICLPRTRDLPAVRWKCFNLERLKTDDPSKHAQQRTLLESLLS